MTAQPKQEIIWTPQAGPQTALLECPTFEVFYGGARGGGKTEGSIGDWLQHSAAYSDRAIGVFFRRKFKQLEEVIARTQQIFPKIGASWNSQRAEWKMSNGARLKFRYIERDSDAEEYQGHSYTRVYVEEVTNFPTARPINLLRATVRSATGVPCGMRLTGNPGGPGHGWVKKRYIDPDRRGYRIITERYQILGKQVDLDRVFIPSKIVDNPMLLQSDPGYVGRLYQVGSKQLVKAWLDGDWDAVEGAFFSEFDSYVHVLPAWWESQIPHTATRFRAFDWGSAKPFSVGWYALSDGTWGLPDGALFKYREWYGASGPNVGLKLDARVVAAGIKERTPAGEHISYSVADPAIFARDGGPSIFEGMAPYVVFRRADNKRIPGWEQLHMYMKGTNYGTVDWKPLIYFNETCEDTIRTLPIAQHDETKAEDIDTDGEDHALDETRYAVMSRPHKRRTAGDNTGRFVLPKHPADYTLNELVERRRRKRIATEQGLE